MAVLVGTSLEVEVEVVVAVEVEVEEGMPAVHIVAAVVQADRLEALLG